jgi:RNA-binding protein NOB1
MKSAGILDPARRPSNSANATTNSNLKGPPLSQRAACATTDFAMQNVILQMNLELLSVDGMKVRKLKNWVTRCGACYRVYTNSEYNIGGFGCKRLFCEHCGSDMMQRIAASVDGKTGRLRLHLSNKHKVNLRGTKFSLPKPGSGNRFQGDLLLREDQLLTGAWNVKVKMRSGGKAKNAAAESIFGNDIASNVGCHTRSITCDDIKVGFGRRNPNAVKGRERRGKKKKSDDRACGLRRY